MKQTKLSVLHRFLETKSAIELQFTVCAPSTWSCEGQTVSNICNLQNYLVKSVYSSITLHYQWFSACICDNVNHEIVQYKAEFYCRHKVSDRPFLFSFKYEMFMQIFLPQGIWIIKLIFAENYVYISKPDIQMINMICTLKIYRWTRNL